MDTLHLRDLAEEHLSRAAASSTGRSAHTVVGGAEHRLRHTVLALVAGRSLGEHMGPGEATLVVLRGTVELHAGAETQTGQEADLIVIPPVRHDLLAVTDAVVLLTVAVDLGP